MLLFSPNTMPRRAPPVINVRAPLTDGPAALRTSPPLKSEGIDQIKTIDGVLSVASDEKWTTIECVGVLSGRQALESTIALQTVPNGLPPEVLGTFPIPKTA